MASSASKAAIVLLNFINLRLLTTNQSDWLEKAVITYLWIVSKLSTQTENIFPTKNLFDSIVSNRREAFNVEATHAAQTLIWKRIEQELESQRYETAESWCRLGLHSLFEKSGNINRAKIGR